MTISYQQGYTLLQTLLGVALAGLLTILAIPPVEWYLQRAFQKEAMVALWDQSVRLTAYHGVHHTYVGFVPTVMNTSRYTITFSNASEDGFLLTAATQHAARCQMLTLDHAGATRPEACWTDFQS
jgi:Tfp pilus assembly protein PilE